MCGITGIFSREGSRIDTALLLSMTNSIRHRGPNDEGYLLADTRSGNVEHRRGETTIPEARVPNLREPLAQGKPNLGLGWRRLSIIDLSPTGHQPMANADGSLWLVFNGEIYNYIELRSELKSHGHVFTTKTDGEVILHAYAQWGEDCLSHFNGMWAFALWDHRAKTLFCARDRFGVKPFYYIANGETFAFASEIKALLHHPAVSRKANHQAVYDYLAHATVDHTDETFFVGVKQLPPGHFLKIDDAGRLAVQRYYTLRYARDPGKYDESESRRHVQNFRDLLFDSVKLRLRTDVPLGSCLSGGLDSSTIVCIANSLMLNDGVIDRALIGEHQKTFTAVYDDARYSERPFVEKVIARTGVEAHFVTPDGSRMWDELREVIYHQDEPFNSTSVYAQWNVMRLAHENGITVLLDGQGADELLGGYPWHVPVFQAQLLRRLRMRRLFSELNATSAISGRSVGRQTYELLGKSGRRLLPFTTYERYATPHTMLNRDFFIDHRRSSGGMKKSNDNLQERLYQEETQFNLQQLLHYEDRNSMAFSIEARVPFVDYRVVEYGMQIPSEYKIHDGWSKYPLRCAGEGLLPPEVQWRKDKMGFMTPEKDWMKILRPRIQALLHEEPLRSANFLNTQVLQKQLLADSLPSHILWRFVNLEMWMRIFDVE